MGVGQSHSSGQVLMVWWQTAHTNNVQTNLCHSSWPSSCWFLSSSWASWSDRGIQFGDVPGSRQAVWPDVLSWSALKLSKIPVDATRCALNSFHKLKRGYNSDNKLSNVAINTHRVLSLNSLLALHTLLLILGHIWVLLFQVGMNKSKAAKEIPP